jgi:hypothetical protein
MAAGILSDETAAGILSVAKEAARVSSTDQHRAAYPSDPATVERGGSTGRLDGETMPTGENSRRGIWQSAIRRRGAYRGHRVALPAVLSAAAGDCRALPVRHRPRSPAAVPFRWCDGKDGGGGEVVDIHQLPGGSPFDPPGRLVKSAGPATPSRTFRTHSAQPRKFREKLLRLVRSRMTCNGGWEW